MSQIKVAIADDHPLFRAALTQAVLKNVNTAEVLEAENFQELIRVIESHPDIELVFLDLHMPGNEGFTGLTLDRKSVV